MPTPNASAGAPGKRPLRLAVAGAALLLLAAGAAFYATSGKHRAQQAVRDGEVTVTIQARTCDPMALTVPAGLTRFRIVNQSDRTVEWEILQGVMVVDERENIAPGMSQVMQARLEPGNYTITCGLLSNPRGSLTVTATAESQAARASAPPTSAFIGALSQQRFALSTGSDALLTQIALLRTAIGTHDLPAAQAAYLQARLDYQRIAATAQRFGDLDNRINARADDYAERERDPGFSGFHRIEYGLFAGHSTDGLAGFAQQLDADVRTLQTDMLAQTMPPDHLSENAAQLMRGIAARRATGEEERYSGAVLPAFAANLDAVDQTVALLQPLLNRSAPDVLARVQAASTDLRNTLATYHQGDAWRSYADVDATGRARIAEQAGALADALEAINPALGLSAG